MTTVLMLEGKVLRKIALALTASLILRDSTGVSASEQRCVGWSQATFGSPLAVVHTRAAAAVVCGSGNGSGGVCVGLRGHTVWRHVVLHATAPVTALCSEVGEQEQSRDVGLCVQ
jgi:hypothetical protein